MTWRKIPTHRLFSVLGAVLTLAMLASLFAIRIGVFRSPAFILHEFLRDNPPEVLQRDVLILSGNRAEAAIIEALQKSDQPKRRYMIEYLGRIHSRQAIPSLKALLQDAREEDYIHADALTTIYLIGLCT
jgi:HEAT repeat protein